MANDFWGYALLGGLCGLCAIGLVINATPPFGEISAVFTEKEMSSQPSECLITPDSKGKLLTAYYFATSGDAMPPMYVQCDGRQYNFTASSGNTALKNAYEEIVLGKWPELRLLKSSRGVFRCTSKVSQGKRWFFFYSYRVVTYTDCRLAA